MAESLPDAEQRRAYLTFVFVGAGYAGVEGIAEVQDFVSDVIDRYPRCRIEGARFVLVEDRDRIMPEIPPSLAAFATRELRRRGMEIRTGTRLASIEADAATLTDGERIPTRTVCWTTGVKPSPAAPAARVSRSTSATGRIRVDATTRVEGHENVWAVGDSAAVPDPAKRRQSPSPPTAQHALRQGKVAADNVAARCAGDSRGPFATARSAYSWTWAAQGRGHHARRAAARLPGMVRRAYLPRGRHARRGPPPAAHHDWTVGLLSAARRPSSASWVIRPPSAPCSRIKRGPEPHR